MNSKVTWILFFLCACTPASQLPKATPYDFPNPVDTTTKPVALQEHRIYHAGSVGARNDFAGARLNGFEYTGSQYRALIQPENTPINPSPWYAFKLWSTQQQSIELVLDYEEYRHRYAPKLSTDGSNWSQLPSEHLRLNNDSTEAIINLNLGPDTLWIAAQEIWATPQVGEWAKRLEQKATVELDSIGLSKGMRPLLEMTLGQLKRKKPIVAIISRQHPPEVTGFMALQGFMDRILAADDLSKKFLDQYIVLVYPLMNPDGADEGHWRHNLGGIDLNRDWAYYRQPETKQVADRMVQQAKRYQSDILLGLDFHSTYYDIYYTNTMDSTTSLPDFTDDWLKAIETSLTDYKVRESPSGVGRPVSKSWFYTQFNAVGITYEIGDNTDRSFVAKKGAVSAEAMMKLLIK